MPDPSQQITLADAVVMTTAARQSGQYPIQAWLFKRDILDAILAQPGAMGMRYYAAINSTGQLTLVAVATDASDNDMSAGVLADFALPCPPYCGGDSPLHTGII